jgi:hypothetical protein
MMAAAFLVAHLRHRGFILRDAAQQRGSSVWRLMVRSPRSGRLEPRGAVTYFLTANTQTTPP